MEGVRLKYLIHYLNLRLQAQQFGHRFSLNESDALIKPPWYFPISSIIPSSNKETCNFIFYASYVPSLNPFCTILTSTHAFYCPSDLSKIQCHTLKYDDFYYQPRILSTPSSKPLSYKSLKRGTYPQTPFSVNYSAIPQPRNVGFGDPCILAKYSSIEINDNTNTSRRINFQPSSQSQPSQPQPQSAPSASIFSNLGTQSSTSQQQPTAPLAQQSTALPTQQTSIFQQQPPTSYPTPPATPATPSSFIKRSTTPTNIPPKRIRSSSSLIQPYDIDSNITIFGDYFIDGINLQLIYGKDRPSYAVGYKKMSNPTGEQVQFVDQYGTLDAQTALNIPYMGTKYIDFVPIYCTGKNNEEIVLKGPLDRKEILIELDNYLVTISWLFNSIKTGVQFDEPNPNLVQQGYVTRDNMISFSNNKINEMFRVAN